MFVLAYQDNGRYYVSVVDDKLREARNVDMSNLIRIDDELSKPITGMTEPLTTAVFLPGDNGVDEELFVQVFHRFKKVHYHLKYNWVTG